MYVIANRLFQLGDTTKHSVTNAVVCEITKTAFDDIQPRTAGRCEMLMKSRMPLQPCLDLQVLMRGVIVHDQMPVQVGRRLHVDLRMRSINIRFRELENSDSCSGHTSLRAAFPILSNYWGSHRTASNPVTFNTSCYISIGLYDRGRGPPFLAIPHRSVRTRLPHTRPLSSSLTCEHHPVIGVEDFWRPQPVEAGLTAP